MKKLRHYTPPVVRSEPTPSAPVLLVCTGQVDCDALLGLGYTCCKPTEPECSEC